MSEGIRAIRLPESWAADWVLDRPLGAGAFSTVYRAVRRDRSNVEAAIKIISIPGSEAEAAALRSEGMTEEQSQSYFDAIARDYIYEIDLMEEFKGNTNIVSIEDYKVVRKPYGPGNYIFIRMELLKPLDAVLRNRTLTEPEVIRLGIDICRALELCESKSIIHRDIKPANIFVNDKMPGRVFFKLGDFGVARSMQALTHTLSKKGTPNYMAPEVFLSKSYDHRADLYSLGITMYRLLNNNRLPFMPVKDITPAAREEALARRLGGETLPQPENCSGAIARVVLKACAFKPEDRFRNASEMRAALEALQRGNDPLPNGAYIQDDRTVPVQVRENKGNRNGKKKNPGMIAALCVCAVMILAAVIILVTRLGNKPDYPAVVPVPEITAEITDEPTAAPTEEPTQEPTDTPAPAQLSGYATVTADSLQVMDYPGEEGTVISELQENEIVYVTNQFFENGRTWHKIQYRGSWGYARADELRMMGEQEVIAYLEELNKTPAPTEEPTAVPTEEPAPVQMPEPTATPKEEHTPEPTPEPARATDEDLTIPMNATLNRFGKTIMKVNFRKGAGTNYGIIRALDKDETVYLISSSLNENNEAWAHILVNGTEGYVMAKYLEMLPDPENEKLMEETGLTLTSETTAPELTAVPTEEPTETPAAEHVPDEALFQPFSTVGDIVTFGRYEQDNNTENGAEEIEWFVLDYDEENHKALLISRYGLDVKPYNTEDTDVTWESCSLRTWLNDEFLKDAFTAKEQSAILLTDVDNSPSQGCSEWSTDGGNNTQDRIFLLSDTEANQYLKYISGRKTDSYSAPTLYAIRQGAETNKYYSTSDGREPGIWWLRSPGSEQNNAACMLYINSRHDFNVFRSGVLVRPAFWLDLESDIVKAEGDAGGAEPEGEGEPAETAELTAVPTEKPAETEEVSTADAHPANSMESLPAEGELVTFGRYEQDNNRDNGAEEIEWLVLDARDGKCLLLSWYGLDTKPYNTKSTGVTWENSTLRGWLNDEFLNTAFTAEEQSAIQLTDVDNGPGQGFGSWKTNGGNNTQDRIFLLSYAEAKRYFGTDYKEAAWNASVNPTAYAKQNNASMNYGVGWWWLRSPGGTQDNAADVYYNGSILTCAVQDMRGCVRPVMWVDASTVSAMPKTAAPTPTVTPDPRTPTPKPTTTPTPKKTPTPTPKPTPAPTQAPTPQLTATPTPIVTATPTPIITATPTPKPTATPTPIITATPKPTATPTPKPQYVYTEAGLEELRQLLMDEKYDSRYDLDGNGVLNSMDLLLYRRGLNGE